MKIINNQAQVTKKTEMTYSDDIAALKAMKTGDKKAFDWIYNKFIRQLRSYAAKIAGSMAEDICHDIFGKLWEERETRNITGSLQAYLQACVINWWRDYWD